MIACPGCGANLRFDIDSQQMKCDYCGQLYDPYLFEDLEKDAVKEKSFDAWVYSCPQCGAELMTTDRTDAEAFCPYCGGASLMLDKIRQEQSPDYIIPFALNKKQCKRAYRKAARKAIFTPARYKRTELVDGFRAIYMPYWSYHVEQRGEAKVKAEGRTSRNGDYLETKTYNIKATVDADYDGYAHDASHAFDDEISECLAPFDIEGRKPFTPGYLSGFYVDVADESSGNFKRDAEDYYEMVTAKRLMNSPKIRGEAAVKRLRLTGVSDVQVPTYVKKIDKVFYPVWFMSYRDGDRITYATVNGQTGKVVADFPVSPIRFLLGALVIAAAVLALLSSAVTLKPEAALIVTNLLMVLGMIVCSRRIRILCSKYSNTVYEVKRTGTSTLGEAALTIVKMVFGIIAALVIADMILSRRTDAVKMMLAATAVMILFIRPRGSNGDRRNVRNGEKTPELERARRLGTALTVICAIASIVILAVKPVYNVIFYAACFVEAAMLFVMISRTLLFQMKLAERRPPQFNKKGGADRA